jgi:hypothetical protein
MKITQGQYFEIEDFFTKCCICYDFLDSARYKHLI